MRTFPLLLVIILATAAACTNDYASFRFVDEPATAGASGAAGAGNVAGSPAVAAGAGGAP